MTNPFWRLTEATQRLFDRVALLTIGPTQHAPTLAESVDPALHARAATHPTVGITGVGQYERPRPYAPAASVAPPKNVDVLIQAASACRSAEASARRARGAVEGVCDGLVGTDPEVARRALASASADLDAAVMAAFRARADLRAALRGEGVANRTDQDKTGQSGTKRDEVGRSVTDQDKAGQNRTK